MIEDVEMNTVTFESPEEAAHGLKFDFDSFFYSWAEAHDISQHQLQFLYKLVRKIGWNFFHEELIEYMEESGNFDVDYDENVIYHEQF